MAWAGGCAMKSCQKAAPKRWIATSLGACGKN